MSFIVHALAHSSLRESFALRVSANKIAFGTLIMGEICMTAPPIPDEIRRRIEEGLRNWKSDGSEARKRYEDAEEEWDKALQPLEEAITASERLTEDDFAIRINTRD